jgi:CheY-like chemotaxis protein
MSAGVQSEFARIYVECAGRESFEIISQIGDELRSLDRHLIHASIVLGHLDQLKGPTVQFLRQLARRVLGSRIAACVVDPSGIAIAQLDQWARGLPIAVYDSESPLARRKRILIVEDNDDNLEFLRSLIESGGHRCSVARQAHQALLLLEQEVFDLVLLDLLLPDADGLAVVRRMEANRRRIPVIAVSGYLGRWSDQVYADLGIRRWLAKPVRARELLDAVHSA